MKVIFLITILLSTGFGYSQAQIFNDSVSLQRYTEWWGKADNFRLKTNQYDSAIYYYQLAISQCPNLYRDYLDKKIADSYLKLGDTTNAEKYYLRCLAVGKSQDSLGLTQTPSCFALADVYLSRRQYNEALLYLDYTKTKFKPLKRRCQRGSRPQLTFAYKKSLCYYGLGKKDSAARVLAPHIFLPAGDWFIDSLELDKMSRYFANTVFEVYGKENASTELFKALGNLTYNVSYTEEGGLVWRWINSSIKFANTTVDLINGGFGLENKEEEQVSGTKEFFIEEFTSSPAYKYIVAGGSYL